MYWLFVNWKHNQNISSVKYLYQFYCHLACGYERVSRFRNWSSSKILNDRWERAKRKQWLYPGYTHRNKFWDLDEVLYCPWKQLVVELHNRYPNLNFVWLDVLYLFYCRILVLSFWLQTEALFFRIKHVIEKMFLVYEVGIFKWWL
jgi:hypothetical protein